MLSAAQRAVASGDRIFQMLDREPAMAVPANAPALPDGNGHVVFRHASLTFAGTRTPALRDIDLDVPAGRTIALVGAMGSGKTAMVSLLPRLYDVDGGSVSIDGADVRTVELSSLRHCDRDRQRRSLSVLGHGPRQHRIRAPRGEPGGRRARRGGRPGGPVHPRPAGGLRHARRRARADALGRAASADRDRARNLSPTRGSWSSTTGPRPSMLPPSSRSSWRCAR